jgi:hypothetical protein
MSQPRYTLRASNASDFPRIAEIMIAASAEDVRKDELLTAARLPARHMIKKNSWPGEVQS